MPNDAKLGLVVGVSLVIVIGVVFFKKDPLPAAAAVTQSAAPATPPAAPPAPDMPETPAVPDPMASDPVLPAVPPVEGTERKSTSGEPGA